MTSPLEVAAATLAIAYLLFAIRQNPWCWPAAILSTGIYVFVMYRAGLYMESALQLFYIAVACYGWWSWLRGGAQGGELQVSRWPIRQHFAAIGAIVLLSLASGALLSRYTQAAYPYLDSLTTWGAIVTTWMVARKILENWFYWFAIDSLSVYLYINRGLFITALLFVLYLVLIVVGYQAWRRSMLTAARPAAAYG
ncbi:MAG: nicotinamide riboside transporter PnuC [Gammaproteobacteria bacterium]|nr:nicotinamide riboside transporter PnuC [Gammaproteobacteria bacterium]